MKHKTSKKEQHKFYCELCDYGCRTKYNLNRHLNTTKHNMKQFETNEEHVENKPCTTNKGFYCDLCLIHFKSRTTLWRHRKKFHTDKCSVVNKTNTKVVPAKNDKETVKQLMNMLIEQQKDTNKLVNSMAKMVENTKNTVMA